MRGMIHRLEIENFYSIREPQMMDLRIGAKTPDEAGRFAALEDGSGERAPKTVALYGANASGKSNVLKAVSLLQLFLRESIQLPVGWLGSFPGFASAEQDGKPTRIRVHFDWARDLSGEDPGAAVERPPSQHTSRNASLYVYEVQFKNSSDRAERLVLSETLRFQPAFGKSLRVFERNEAGKVRGGALFPTQKLGHILEKMRPDASLTSTIAQFAKHRPAEAIVAWAEGISVNILSEKMELDDRAVVGYYAGSAQMVEELNKVIDRVDLGIKSLSVVASASGPVAIFNHHGLDRSIGLAVESQGTKQFVKIFPTLKKALESGGIAVIDELDSTIHPAFLPEILRWFQDPKENPRNAQLWFSGHSASLLEELQKEEVFFTEKDGLGRTRIYGLKDIDAVRRSDNFYQKYMGGVYGAVPRIG